MKTPRWLQPLFAPAVILVATGCGGIDYEYNASRYAQSVDATPGGVAIVDVADTRVTLDAPDARADDFEELKAAFHEHLKLSGVIGDTSQLLPTPNSKADVERILEEAAAKGGSEVVFFNWRAAGMSGYAVSLAFLAGIGGIGIIPWLIVDSLPLSRHQGSSIFAAISVDPKTKEVLHISTPLGAYGEKVSAWGFAPDKIMRNVTGVNVQRCLEDAAAARKAGFPNRRAVDDIGEYVLHFPENRIEGSNFVGVGFSVPVPDGFSLDGQSLFADDNKSVTMSVIHLSTLLRADDSREKLDDDISEELEKSGQTVESKDQVELDGHPALALKVSSGADKAISRIVFFHGWQMTIACKGPAAATAELDACVSVLDKARFDVATLPID
ncbi:MAG: hypothetical protein U0271_32225 [Polyangiaceae bacterium]